MVILTVKKKISKDYRLHSLLMIITFWQKYLLPVRVSHRQILSVLGNAFLFCFVVLNTHIFWRTIKCSFHAEVFSYQLEASSIVEEIQMFATWTFYADEHYTETQRNHIFPQMPLRMLYVLIMALSRLKLITTF